MAENLSSFFLHEEIEMAGVVESQTTSNMPRYFN